VRDPGIEDFGLVFLDLLMPRIHGVKVLWTMRAEHICPPVIVLSSVAQRDTMIQVFRMGIKGYLVKPLKAEAVFAKTMEILRSSF
jgi:DNA-binding response OmpR family regulator